MNQSQILNTITIGDNIFFKAKIRGVNYVKLIPCYDVEHGIVMRIMMPTEHTETLDKGWIKLEYSSPHDVFRFSCPSFLKKYKGAKIETYEDSFPIPGELCRVRMLTGDFSNIRHLIKVPRGVKYKPFFSKDGRFHVSLAFVRNNFPASVKKGPYVQVSSVDNAVINHEIMVSVFSGKYLSKGEIAFRLKRYEHELVTPPIKVLLTPLEDRLANFKFKKRENTEHVTAIYTVEEIKRESNKRGIGRRVPSLRQRAIRARRQRDASRRAEEEYRRKAGLLDFKRK